MVTSYGETSGFTSVESEDLATVNGGSPALLFAAGIVVGAGIVALWAWGNEVADRK